jgi:hypothetical protein
VFLIKNETAEKNPIYSLCHLSNIHQKIPKGRPEIRCRDEVENDIRKMEIVNWRQVVQYRDMKESN